MRRAIVVLAVLAGLVGCNGEEPVAEEFPRCEPDRLLREGEPLPACRFEGFPGHEDLALADLEGVPTVINFWAAWCPNCIKEMPAFQRVAGSLGGRVRFVGMDLLEVQGETKRAAIDFAERTGVRYALAFDPGGYFYSHFGRRSAAPVMPLTVFVKADGTLHTRRFGELNEEELREQIAMAFGVS